MQNSEFRIHHSSFTIPFSLTVTVVAALPEKIRQAPPGSPGKVQGRNMIGLFIIGQPHRHLQEISGCLPMGVAEEKRADGLDGVGNSAIEVDKTEITDVVSTA